MKYIYPFFGHVSKDPVQKTGKESGKPYVLLNIKLPVGFKENRHNIFVQAQFSGVNMDRLLKAGVKKDDCLVVYGDLDHLSVFTPKDEPDKVVEIIKVWGTNWDYLPTPYPDSDAAASAPGDRAPAAPPASSAGSTEVHDLDDDDDGELPF